MVFACASYITISIVKLNYTSRHHVSFVMTSSFGLPSPSPSSSTAVAAALRPCEKEEDWRRMRPKEEEKGEGKGGGEETETGQSRPGQSVGAVPNSPISLNDPLMVWLVLSRILRLFLRHVERDTTTPIKIDSEPSSQNHFLLSCNQRAMAL